MWLYIIAYIVLTGVAIYVVREEDVLQTDNLIEFAIRIFFLLTIGWLSALMIIIGGCCVWVSVAILEQMIDVQLDQRERVCAMPWAVNKIKDFVKKLFIRKNREAELCTNNSQTEPEKS